MLRRAIDKDSLIARLASESTGDAASVIMDALYKAEQAADDAARASGDLQEVLTFLNCPSAVSQAVELARSTGVLQEFISWADGDANEFFEPDYSGTIKYNAAALAEEEKSVRDDNVE